MNGLVSWRASSSSRIDSSRRAEMAVDTRLDIAVLASE